MGLFGLGRGAAPVGLDIGSSTIRVAQLKSSADKPALIKYASIEAPKGIINEGEITDIDGVSKVLIKLWRDNRISEKKVIVGVANQKVVVRVIEMPFMTEAELRTAIQYQINDYIPIPAEEAIIDFQIISEHENNQQERMISVLVVAARKEMIENTVLTLEKAGLKPVIVDVSSLAFARAVMDNSPQPLIPDDATGVDAIAMLNISSDLTDIVVVEGGVPRFTRISSIGGNTFTEVLMEELGLSFDEAEELKEKVGLLPVEDEDVDPDDIDSDVIQYADAVRNVLEHEMMRFIAEIRRSLDYYLVQTTKVKSINKIIVSGGGAGLKNFLQHLKRDLRIEAEFGQPLSNVNVSRSLSNKGIENEELSLAICIGLAIRGIDG